MKLPFSNYFRAYSKNMRKYTKILLKNVSKPTKTYFKFVIVSKLLFFFRFFIFLVVWCFACTLLRKWKIRKRWNNKKLFFKIILVPLIYIVVTLFIEMLFPGELIKFIHFILEYITHIFQLVILYLPLHLHLYLHLIL